MRWAALGVDYEMSGKDLDQLGRAIADQICRILGAQPPEGFNYELFLDEKGEKISKSKGNGLTDGGVAHLCGPESLSLYHVSEAADGEAALFRRDPAGRRRISRPSRGQYPKEDAGRSSSMNPVWHIHARRAAARPSSRSVFRAAAEPRLGGERRGQGGALGLHPPLRARRHAARRIRCSISSSATRCATTTTS